MRLDIDFYWMFGLSVFLYPTNRQHCIIIILYLICVWMVLVSEGMTHLECMCRFYLRDNVFT